MRPRQLFAQLALFAAAFAGLNRAVAWLDRDAVARRYVVLALEEPPADVIVVGNSTMVAAFGEEEFRAASGRAGVNVAVGATSPVEQLAAARAVLPRHPGATLVMGYFEMHLTDAPHGALADLTGTRAMVFEFGPDLAAEFYAPNDPLKRLGLRVVAELPLLYARRELWGRVERVRRDLGGVGLATPAGVRFGRADDFFALYPDPVEFRERARRTAANRAPFTGPVARILQLGYAGGTVLVEMPMPGPYRARYTSTPEYEQYRAHIRTLAAEAGVRVVRADDWVPDAGFEDPLHVNQDGREAFTARLASELGR